MRRIEEYQKLYDLCKKKHRIKYEKHYTKIKGQFSMASRQFNTTILELTKLFLMFNGTICKYCGTEINVDNVSFDHVIPMDRGGAKSIKNCDIICRKCNTRKGVLNNEEFKAIMDVISSFEDKPRKYILRKLAMADYNKHMFVVMNKNKKKT